MRFAFYPKEDYFAFAVLLCMTFISISMFSEGSQNVDSTYTVKTTKLECEFNRIHVANWSCKLKPLSWNKTIANIKLNLAKEIRKLSIRMELFKYTNQYRPFLINITINLCKWLDTKEYQHPYSFVFMKMLKDFTNINHPCPLSGTLTADEIYCDSKSLNYIFPAGKFLFRFIFLEGFPFENMGTVDVGATIIQRGWFER